MSSVRVRRTIHRGSVLASGLAIDTRLVPASAARRRVLGLSAHVRIGRVLRAETFLVVTFEPPTRLDSTTAIGTPLVRHGHLLAAAPLAPDELEALQRPAEVVVLAKGGSATAHALEDLAVEDLSSWIDVSPFSVVTNVQSLGRLAAAPLAAIVTRTVNVHESLGVEPLTEAARKVVESLLRASGTGSASGGARPPSALARWLASAWAALRFSPKRTLSAPGRTGRPPEMTLPSGESWFARVFGALSRWATQKLFSSRIAAFFGRRQAEYLARMLDMFDANQLDDALRHAIPLSSSMESALKREPLSTPSPRTDLAIVPKGPSAATSLGLGRDLFELLRQRYRKAFEQLVAAGEVEKAAFVLAELLNANEEAVAFLERHERFKLAAEIAEARKLSPGLVVRLWFLAGERARAIRVARATRAFGEAVTRLEASHPDEARALRLMWADALASSGAYAGAVDAIWPIADTRHLAITWLDRAIEIGGVTGARMLVRKAVLVPEAFSEVRNHVLALLEDASTEPPVVEALARAITAAGTIPETQPLAKATARRLLRHADDREMERLLRKLTDVSGDGALREDVRASRHSSDDDRPTEGPIHVHARGVTHTGVRRAFNEDAFVVTFLDDTDTDADAVGGDAARRGLLFGVFDGTGGSGAGDVAAPMAAANIRTELGRCFSKHGTVADDWASLLAASIDGANRWLLAEADRSPQRRGIGCTATVATLRGDTLLVAQVGETRAYVLRANTLVQVTREHSLLNHYIDAMQEKGTPMTTQEIEGFPHADIVVRALGSQNDLVVDVIEVELQQGDVTLLCSDGLWRYVNDERIRQTLVECETVKLACDALLAMALDAGAADNLAIVVARFEGAGLRSTGGPIEARAVGPFTNGDRPQGVQALRSTHRPVVVRRTAADCGTMEVFDVAELPDGRMLVALGEVGVWLIARDGRVLTRFSEPAHRLVLSDHGDRAILVARRGEACRLARLDVFTRRARRWCDARIDHFASDFDGFTWLVSLGDTVHAIEATAETWEHHWKVDEPGATVASIERDTNTVCVWFAGASTSGEVWEFDAPALTLRRRGAIAHDDRQFITGAIAALGDFAGWTRSPDGALLAQARVRGTWHDLPIATDSPPAAPWLAREWIAIPIVGSEVTTIHLFDGSAPIERARIELERGPRGVGVRFRGDHLCIFDGHGRVIVLSLQTGTVLREHRIS